MASHLFSLAGAGTLGLMGLQLNFNLMTYLCWAFCQEASGGLLSGLGPLLLHKHMN